MSVHNILHEYFMPVNQAHIRHTPLLAPGIQSLEYKVVLSSGFHWDAFELTILLSDMMCRKYSFYEFIGCRHDSIILISEQSEIRKKNLNIYVIVILH